MRYFLENDCLKVEIESFGAEIKSVIRKENMREYLWYGNPRFWGRTSPVLFPFVGSLKDKKYSYQGKEYPMGQHGFARDMEFELVSKEEREIWFCLRSNEETLAKYPFAFALSIGYRLMKDQVDVLWKVENPGSEKLYFSIGAHPAFLCPVHGESEKTGYRLIFDGVDEIHHHGNTLDAGMALREDLVLPLTDSYAEITKEFFDRCTYMIEGKQTGKVGIADREGNRIVDVIFDAPLFAVWSPEGKNAPFLCIEPWYGRCDAIDFDGDLTEREYTQILEPAGGFEAGYSMVFHYVAG